MKTYSITITRFDENDEMTELVDQYISADAAIDLMIQVQGLKELPSEVRPAMTINLDTTNITELIEDIKETTYTKPLPEPQKEYRVNKCGNCGGYGHNARKCPQRQIPEKITVSIPETPKTAAVKNEEGKDYRSLTAKVRELFDGGLSYEEVCDTLPGDDMVEIKVIYEDFEKRLKGQK